MFTQFTREDALQAKDDALAKRRKPNVVAGAVVLDDASPSSDDYLFHLEAEEDVDEYLNGGEGRDDDERTPVYNNSQDGDDEYSSDDAPAQERSVLFGFRNFCVVTSALAAGGAASPGPATPPVSIPTGTYTREAISVPNSPGRVDDSEEGYDVQAFPPTPRITMSAE